MHLFCLIDRIIILNSHIVLGINVDILSQKKRIGPSDSHTEFILIGEGTFKLCFKELYVRGPMKDLPCVVKIMKTGPAFQAEVFKNDMKTNNDASQVVDQFLRFRCQRYRNLDICNFKRRPLLSLREVNN